MISFLFTNMFIYIQQLRCHSTCTQIHIQFSVTNIFIHICNIYSFTFKLKSLFNSVAIFIQHFVDVQNSTFFHIERFIILFHEYIYSYTRHIFIHIRGQKFYSTQLLYSFNILCASLFTHHWIPSSCLLYFLETRIPSIDF